MRKVILASLAALLAAGLGAQALKIATMEQTAFYGPAVLKAMKEAGFDGKIVTMTQPEIIKALSEGAVDGAFFLADPLIAEAKGATRVSVRLMQTDFIAVTLDPAIKIANPGDLRKYKVGIAKGQSAHAAITRGMKTAQAETDIEEFKLLAEGKVQAIIAVDKAVPALAAASGLKSYTIQQPPLIRSPTFLALSKAQADKKAALEAVLKKWVDDGRWEKEMAAAEAAALKR